MLPQGDGLALWLWPCQEPRSGQPAQTPAAAKAAGIRGTMAGLLPGVLLGAWDIWCGGVRGVSSRLQCPNRYLLQPGQRGLGPGWALQSSTQGASTPWRAGGRRPVCSLHDGCVSGGKRVYARGGAGVCPGGAGVFRCAVPPHGCTWHGEGLLAHVPGLTVGMAWEARRRPLSPRPGGPAPSP